MVTDKLVLAALVVAESAWVYALLGMVGLGLGAGGGPLGWLAILGVLGASTMVARVLQSVALPLAAKYAVQMALGALTIYLTIATQVSADSRLFDLGWIGTLASGAGGGGYVLRGILGSLVSVALWWRGGRMAASDAVTETLEFSFKVGVLVLALAVIVDIVSATDLNTFPIMFLFFAASLGGLGIGRVGPTLGGAKAAGHWLRVVAAVVSAVLVVGLVFSLLTREHLSWVVDPVLKLLGGAGTVVFYAVIVPLSFVINALIGLMARVTGGEVPENLEEPVSFGEQFLRQQQDVGTPLYVTVVEWALLALLVAVVLYILARAFRRRLPWRHVEAEGQRESVRSRADPAYDAAHVLFDILPSWLKRRRGRRRMALPEGPSGVVEALRLYYRMLLLGEARGLPRGAFETPREYQARLVSALPEGLVREATEAFNRACYGNQPTPGERLAQMRAQLDRLGAAEAG